MAIAKAKLVVLGNENETKKSHIITKFVVSNGGKYDDKATITQQININNDFTQPLIFEIPPIDITEKYNLKKNAKSSHDKQIKSTYNSANIIFIIYNVCNSKTFRSATKYYDQYKQNINNMDNSNVIVVLIGHKLGSYTSFKRDIKREDGEQYALQNDLLFFEVSITDNSIDILFKNVAKMYMDKIRETMRLHRNTMKPMIPSKKKAIFDNNYNEISAAIMKVPQFINDPFNQKINDENDVDNEEIDELKEKMADYENIVYSLEHTLSLHERDKKQLLDLKMESESESIQLKLENESKERQIQRQNDEINKLIADLRNANNKIDEIKNNNLSSLSQKRSKPKAPPRRRSSIFDKDNDSNKENIDDILLIKEKPLRPRSITTMNTEKASKLKRDRTASNDSNMFTKISNTFKVFSPSKANDKSSDNENENESNIDELEAKCNKLSAMTDILKKEISSKDDEILTLKEFNTDLTKQLSSKQREINHLRACLEDNQLGFTRYKDETEQKLIKWRGEKKHWFDKYKNINKENQSMIDEIRKLQSKVKKLEKAKEKYKKKALSPKVGAINNNNNESMIIMDDSGDDKITMDKITISSLISKRSSFSSYDETWNIPQLLRTFNTLKKNNYNNLIEKIVDDDNDDQHDECSKMKKACHILYDTLIECYKFVENTKKNTDIQVMCEQKKKYKDMLFETMRNRFKDIFNRWFNDENILNEEGSNNNNNNGDLLQCHFKKYIIKCLQICMVIQHLGLQLYPFKFIENNDDENIFNIDNILNYGDIMQRDDIFDSTPNDNKWYCSFPVIIKNNDNDNKLNEKQILEIIKKKTKEKYDIFQSKMWMFQT